MPMQLLNNGTNGVIKGLGWGLYKRLHCAVLVFAVILCLCSPVVGEKKRV